MTSERHLLRLASRLWGMQTGYTGVDGRAVEAPDSTLRKLLGELSGKSAKNAKDLEELICIAREEHRKKRLEPVNVVWSKDPAKSEASRILVTIPNAWLKETLEYTIRLEDGRELKQSERAPKVLRNFEQNGEAVSRVSLTIPAGLPTGYHFIFLTKEPKTRAHLFIAPERVFGAERSRKRWGGFVPLYAVRSEANWGIGDLSDLREMQSFVKQTGGDFFGTLPMLASSGEGKDYDPSPYSPVSRLFWNEIHLDPWKYIADSEKASAFVQTSKFQKAWETARGTDVVDYPKVFALKKQVFLILADEFFESKQDLSREYIDFLSRAPLAKDYAEFRANGKEAERRYHLYVQFRMDEELNALAEEAKAETIAGLYLDFPVGVSRGGFDSKKFSESFVLTPSAGAPPDGLFPCGQNWGFAPMHPLRIREQGYTYFIESVRQHMRYATILRIDHFMGLHRIYVIPEGSDPKSGTYLRFFSEEFYALLTIESHRAQVEIVGEDLGTVPESVKHALDRHGFLHMWVLPFEAGQSPTKAIRTSTAAALSCVNTHDMVPFAGHRKGRDSQLFAKLKVIDEKAAKAAAKERRSTLASWVSDLGLNESEGKQTPDPMLAKLLKLMAAAPTKLLLVNLEDLWGETEPQNIPGTWKEYPNWRRKAEVPLEYWPALESMTSLLQDLSARRKDRKNAKSANVSRQKPKASRSRSASHDVRDVSR